MKIILLTLSLLVCGLHAEAPPALSPEEKFNLELMEDCGDLLKILRDKGWSIEGMSTRMLGRMNVIYRNQRPIGYCVVESTWELVGPEKVSLNDVTEITLGDPSMPDAPNDGVWLSIKDPHEIPLWVAAVRNHYRLLKHTLQLYPLVPDAGFPKHEFPLDYRYALSGDVGLRFYKNDELLLTLRGSWWYDDSNGVPVHRDDVLRSLVRDAWVRKPKVEQKAKNIEVEAVEVPNEKARKPSAEQGADGNRPSAEQSPDKR